ncbi:MAG: efflux RND transporter permease subunit [Deltaproteobacteria bacterium]|nr:efflux RND transporter permease subunit [Deltaproteobacteria bacterium]
MHLANISVKQPVLANLVALLAIISGVFAYMGMAKRSMPVAPLNMAFISTTFPGASPEDVELLITRKIEEEIADVEDIKTMESISREGFSIIIVEFEQNVEDMGDAIVDLNNEVKKVNDLPAGIDPPEVTEGIVEFIGLYVAIEGDADPHVVREVAMDLKEEITRLPDVARASFIAWRDREVWVELDPQSLSAYHLTPQAVAAAIAERNANVPAGSVRTDRSELLVRTVGEFDTADDVGQVVVLRDNQGAAITVNDLGTVDDTFEENLVRANVNGKTGVVIEVFSADDGNAFHLVEDVKDLVAEFQDKLPPGVRVSTFMDTSKELRNTLSNLMSNALFGLGLVAVTLWMFIGLRGSLMAVIGLPVAVLGGVAILKLWGVSVNQLSLFGMILVLGILVDDSIVVIENIARHMAMGENRVEAVVHGAREVTWPVVSATGTTVAAFSSLFMMTGVMGTFLANIPKVVIAALVASLVEALFILPSHMAEHGRPLPEGDWRDAFMDRLRGRYVRALNWVLKHRYRNLAASLALAVIMVALGATVLDVKLMEDPEPEYFEVRLEMPPGTRLSATEAFLEQIRARLGTLDSSAIQDVMTVSGFSLTDGPSPNRGTNYGSVFYFLTPRKERTISGFTMIADAREQLRDMPVPVSLEVAANQVGPPVGAPIAIEVRGKEADVLLDLADRVREELASIDGVEDVRTDYVPGKKELQIHTDPAATAMLGLTHQQIASHVRAAFYGIPATTLKAEREEADVLVKFQDSMRDNIDNMRALMIRTADGRDVALGEAATVTEELGGAAVRRIDRKRAITVLANVNEDKTTAVAINQAVAPLLAELERQNPGYTLEAGGEFEMTAESFRSLGVAFVISFLIIFAILGAQFKSYIQPMIVMAAIPFSFIGVVFGLMISGKAISLFSLMGIIALAGIVVNDSLVLVDFINVERTRGTSRRASILEAASKRLRPIILTTVTTMVGLIPMAYSFIGEENLMLTPMALAIVWGVSASTLLTLFLIPCMYAILDDIRAKVTGEQVG